MTTHSKYTKGKLPEQKPPSVLFWDHVNIHGPKESKPPSMLVMTAAGDDLTSLARPKIKWPVENCEPFKWPRPSHYETFCSESQKPSKFSIFM